MKFGRGFIYRLIGLSSSILLSPFIVLERLLFGLQSQASWVFPAVFRSLWLIYKRRPDVIYTTGGAYSAHHAGYWLKRLTGIKWIAEIHDPMVVASGKKSRNELFMAKLEGYICRNADVVWWFTEGALESARNRYPELGKRGVVILPGVEPFSTKAEYHRGEQMIIGHFGSLSSTRSLYPVVSAIAILLKRMPEIRSNLRIHVYGGSIDALARKEIDNQGLSDVFISFGRLEKSVVTGKSGREQVVDLMHQVDCLLMVHGKLEDCREYIPSKVYEYFWAGRPIIALTYQNPQLDRMMIERSNYVAAYDNESQIVELLAKAYADWNADELPNTTIPAIGTKQAVDAILKELADLI
jgi:hypothetical protein